MNQQLASQLADRGIRIETDPDQPGYWYWTDGFVMSDISYPSQEEAAREALRAQDFEGEQGDSDAGEISMRLVLDVTYTPNGVPESVLRDNLQNLVQRAVGEGLLTGNLEAEVEEYRASVVRVETIDEDALRNYFTDRIEDGNLPLEDITRVMVRYGLMDPSAFCAEMAERMEGANEEGA